MITKQQSENIDLAEKGLKSSVNPTHSGLDADPKDKKTVMQNVKPNAVPSIIDEDFCETEANKPMIDRSDCPDPNKSQAV